MKVKVTESESTACKVGNRFIVTFNDPWNIPSYFVKYISLPSFKLALFKENTYEFNRLLIEFYDTVKPSASLIIKNAFKENSNISFRITLLDAISRNIGYWDISGIIEGIDFGSLAYSNSELLSVKMWINITNAELYPGNDSENVTKLSEFARYRFDGNTNAGGVSGYDF